MANNRARSPADRQGLWALIAANVLILGLMAGAAVLESSAPDTYYQAVQEDEALEWATFWAFMVAAGLFVAAAVGQRHTGRKVPWFLAGLAAFCFVVAMEEISWGQRVATYRPPAYFLEHNFQQELNVHNLFDTGLRKLALKGVILGYGVFLPLLLLVPAVRRLGERFAVVAPPWQLAPAFIGTWWLYEDYPWDFSGEWVEMMLGLGFLFAALAGWRALRPRAPEAGRGRPLLQVLVASLAVLVLGAVSALATRALRRADDRTVDTTRRELEALASDFRSGRVECDCNLHKRVYTFMVEYEQEGLLEGAFAGLTAQGLPEARARFMLDPWSSPYWLRDRCKSGRRVTFVYSFGPNRRRESSRWEILGDDIGVYIRGEG